MFVLVGDGVPVDEAFLLGSVFGKIGGFKEIRYSGFSRSSGVMQEFNFQWDRWRLSFDGSLVRSAR